MKSRFFRRGFLGLEFIVILFLSIYGASYWASWGGYVAVESDYQQNVYLGQLVDWIGVNTTPQDVIGAEEGIAGMGTFCYRTGFMNLDSVVPSYVDRQMLFGNFGEGTKNAGRADILFRLKDTSPDEIHLRLRENQVDYLITASDESFQNINGSDLFDVVYQNQLFAVWKLEKPDSQVEVIRFERGPSSFAYEISSADDVDFVLPVNYDDKWKTYVNGIEYETRRSSNGLIRVELGKGMNTLELYYSYHWTDLVSYAITAGSIAAAASIYIYRKSDIVKGTLDKLFG